MTMKLTKSQFLILKKAIESCSYTDEIYGNTDFRRWFDFDFKKVEEAKKLIKVLLKNCK